MVVSDTDRECGGVYMMHFCPDLFWSEECGRMSGWFLRRGVFILFWVLFFFIHSSSFREGFERAFVG